MGRECWNLSSFPTIPQKLGHFAFFFCFLFWVFVKTKIAQSSKKWLFIWDKLTISGLLLDRINSDPVLWRSGAVGKIPAHPTSAVLTSNNGFHFGFLCLNISHAFDAHSLQMEKWNCSFNHGWRWLGFLKLAIMERPRIRKRNRQRNSQLVNWLVYPPEEEQKTRLFESTSE